MRVLQQPTRYAGLYGELPAFYAVRVRAGFLARTATVFRFQGQTKDRSEVFSERVPGIGIECVCTSGTNLAMLAKAGTSTV